MLTATGSLQTWRLHSNTSWTRTQHSSEIVLPAKPCFRVLNGRAKMHPVRKLMSKLSQVEPYPVGVRRIPATIAGTAFFPGGSGLWNPTKSRRWPPMPIGGVMILGHDFDSEESYYRSLQIGDETTGPTWRNLIALLDEVGIPLDVCFFTNAYMGMRAGGLSMGRFPGATDAEYVDRCRKFLMLQLQVQRPCMLLTLGKWVPRFISPLSDQLSHWSRAASFADIDTTGPVVLHCMFKDAKLTTNVVTLTHTCLRHSNVGRRRFARKAGHAAEVAMLRKASCY
jgi:hypothetical protein